MKARARVGMPEVLVIDKTTERAEQTVQLLRSAKNRLTRSIELEIRGTVRSEARDLLKKRRCIETCLIVTDQAGLVPARDAVVPEYRKAFQRAFVVLYSLSAEDKDIARWKKIRLVDDVVKKSEPVEHLIRACRRQLAAYFSDATLNAVRKALISHPAMESRYLEVNGISQSPVDLYREIVKGSSLGQALLSNWKSLSAPTDR